MKSSAKAIEKNFGEKSFDAKSRTISPACENAYPRPQLERSQWTCLNGEWKLAFDDEGRCECPNDLAKWTHAIAVCCMPIARPSFPLKRSRLPL